jgi:hypothetical protein
VQAGLLISRLQLLTRCFLRLVQCGTSLRAAQARLGRGALQFFLASVSPLAKIGNDSGRMRRDGEFLLRVVFDLEVRRKPRAFAAGAVGIDIYIYKYGVSIAFFLIGLHSSSEFGEFRAIRHGCSSIRLFTSCDSHPIPASNLLASQCRSGRGACGFVLAG